MSVNRQDIITEALRTALRERGAGQPLTEADAASLARSIEEALAREDTAVGPGEGHRPEDLNSANDG